MNRPMGKNVKRTEIHIVTLFKRGILQNNVLLAYDTREII